MKRLPPLVKAARLPGNILTHFYQPRPALPADAIDDFHRLGELGGGDDRAPRLDDARLLAGNLRQRIPQHFHVVVADGRDNADLRLHHVSGIEPTPQTHLQHLVVRLDITKMGERHRCI